MLVSTPGRSLPRRVLTVGEIRASIVISENLPRRQGLPPTPGWSLRTRVLNRGEIRASIVISENLPAARACRQCRAGRQLSVLTGPLEAEAGWELGGGRWEPGGKRDPHV